MTTIRIFALAACLALPCAVPAQQYPAKPVRVVVGFAPGAIQDFFVRLMAERMAVNIAQPVIVENRVGAGGRTGVEAVARMPADGYTIVLGSAATHVLSTYLVKALPYDPVKDFTPLSLAIRPPIGIVISAAVPANNIREFVAYVKANPGKVAYASTGVGSSTHFVGERLKLAAGLDMLHVPLTGGSDSMNALLGGHVQMSFAAPAQAVPLVSSGKIRLIAVGLSQRFAPQPNVPTLAESVPGYDTASDWFAFFGPAGLPGPVASRLNAEIVKALNAPEVRGKLDATSVVVASSAEELAATMRNDLQVFARIVKAVGVPAQ